MPFFATGHIKICCLSYHVPNAQTPKTFGEKDVGALKSPGRDWDQGPQAPHSLTRPRGSLGVSARPPPREPAQIGADPSGGPRAWRPPHPAGSATHSDRPRASPSTRGEAWERPVSHRPQHGVRRRRPRRRHLPALRTAWRPRGEAPKSFASLLPARQGPADN